MVVRNSVDQKLEAMGLAKENALKPAYGDEGGRLAELTVEEMQRLFDPFYENGHPKEDGFLYVDEPTGDSELLV